MKEVTVKPQAILDWLARYWRIHLLLVIFSLVFTGSVYRKLIKSYADLSIYIAFPESANLPLIWHQIETPAFLKHLKSILEKEGVFYELIKTNSEAGTLKAMVKLKYRDETSPPLISQIEALIASLFQDNAESKIEFQTNAKRLLSQANLIADLHKELLQPISDEKYRQELLLKLQIDSLGEHYIEKLYKASALITKNKDVDQAKILPTIDKLIEADFAMKDLLLMNDLADPTTRINALAKGGNAAPEIKVDLTTNGIHKKLYRSRIFVLFCIIAILLNGGFISLKLIFKSE